MASDDKTIQDRLLRMKRGLVAVRDVTPQPFMFRQHYERVNALMIALIAEVDDILAEHPVTPASDYEVGHTHERWFRCNIACPGWTEHPATPAEVECRWCPPGCKSCEPDDCECYTHQDEPDKTSEPDAGEKCNHCRLNDTYVNGRCTNCGKDDSGDVGGLSEGERESLSNTVRDVIGRSYGFDAICRAVERIVAVREREAAARERERIAQAIETARDGLDPAFTTEDHGNLPRGYTNAAHIARAEETP